jgi:hypothetical protein
MNKKVTAPFIYLDVVNKNGRIYTKECAKDIVKQFGELQHNGHTIITGELGNPTAFTASSDNICYKVEEIHLDEEKKCVVGTIELLDTRCGLAVQKLLQPHLNWFDKILTFVYKLFGKVYPKSIPKKFEDMFAMSSRGSGTVNDKGEVENYRVHTFDIIPKSESAFKNMNK